MGARKVRLTTEAWIEKARAVHGERYDYSRVQYLGMTKKVEIICPDHGPFWQSAGNHVSRASRCPQCAGFAPTNVDQFLERSRSAHGGRYDYSLVEYHGVQKRKVKIICPDHGVFEQLPLSHMQGRGCPACGVAQNAGQTRLGTGGFVERARAVHSDRFDYSRVQYQNMITKVEIICPEHGAFWQLPKEHLNSPTGCPACSRRRKIDKTEFLRRAQDQHGERYDYGQLDYQGWTKPARIICRVHGAFEQIAKTHAMGSGCPACAGLQPVTLQSFIQRARAIHGERYDYARVKLKSVANKVEIICPEHGSFWQRPQDHVGRQYGCPACAGRAVIDYATFLQRARAVHGERYTYSAYQHFKAPVQVTCEKHGAFSVLPQNHLKGCECPRCASERTTSRAEDDLANWIADLGFAVERNDRRLLDGMEVDILVPGRNLGIEYNGSYWHRDDVVTDPRYHEKKTAAAERIGLRLFSVWDFDLKRNDAVIRRSLRYALGVADDARADARRCELVSVDDHDARYFFDTWHIQGGIKRRAVNLGLLSNGELVACMALLQGGSRRGRFGASEWELIRYATSALVRGGASRLLRAFTAQYQPQRIWSFSDRQHFAGSLYPALGFERDGVVRADYRVVDKRTLQTWHKSLWQRKHIPKRILEVGATMTFDPATDSRSERQVQDALGMLRVYDSGKIRWRLDG